MNPIVTTIAKAVVAGVKSGASNLATQAIQDAYDGLKALMVQRFAHAPAVQESLKQIEAQPDATLYDTKVEEALAAAVEGAPDAIAEGELLRLAETLLQLVAAEEKITRISIIQPSSGGVAKAVGALSAHSMADSIALTPGSLRRQATSVDPSLQRTAAKAVVAKSLAPTGATDPLESDGRAAQVDLIGQLKDPKVPVPGLRIVRQLGDLFTATAAANDVTTIAQHANIVTVQMAQPISPTLAVSISEIGATPTQLGARLPVDVGVPDGRGVIVGIVDYGCDFAHNNFRHKDGTTRILALWNQDGPFVEGLSPEGFLHGQEFDADTINAALKTPNPYEILGYNPGIASHGTHVMDIAVGNGRATGNPGVAPAANIIFVHIGGGATGQDRSFGNSKNLMEAADYIFLKAAELGQSAVINLSLGTHGGPHDGSTPAERWFDQLLQTPNRAIVVSAGNSWRHRAHAMGIARSDAPTRLPWIIPPNDPTNNEVEIWYAGQHCLEVALFAPDGSLLVTVPRGHRQSVFNPAGEEVVNIIHGEFDARNGDHQISILLDHSLAPTGTEPDCWQIELRAVGDEETPFHAWVERDDMERESLSFFHPGVVSTSHTLGSISCGRSTIAVGSYRAGDADRGISSFSSEGPTRDGRQKPEISAPGQHVAAPQDQAGLLAAESGTNGATRKSGTSMAAPHVTGLVALLLQTATEPLCIEQIRTRIFAAVRGDPPTPTAWHPQYGFGRLDVGAVLSLEEATGAYVHARRVCEKVGSARAGCGSLVHL